MPREAVASRPAPGPAPFPRAVTAGLFLTFSLERVVGVCTCLSGIGGASPRRAELCARRCPHGPHQASQGTADLPPGSRRETLESGAGDYELLKWPLLDTLRQPAAPAPWTPPGPLATPGHTPRAPGEGARLPHQPLPARRSVFRSLCSESTPPPRAQDHFRGGHGVCWLITPLSLPLVLRTLASAAGRGAWGGGSQAGHWEDASRPF